MFFVIKSNTTNSDLAKYRTKRYARKALALYTFGVTEALINNFLQANYKITLYDACKKILQNLTFSLNYQGEIIGKIPDEELNEIARIITYGTGRIPGSQILRKILTLS